MKHLAGFESVPTFLVYLSILIRILLCTPQELVWSLMQLQCQGA